ncbi:hypothetical protein ACNUDN_02167 [Mycobacterium sp. smrl_JER01]
MPTRGVRAAGLGVPGRGPPGPGRGPGVGRADGAAGVGGAAAAGLGGAAAGAGGGAAAAGGATGGGGADGCCGAGGPGLGAGRLCGADGLAGAGAAADPLPLAAPLPLSGLEPPNDSRSRRATGASTVEDADLTNSPCSLSRASTSLLVTPSSLANSCTRALPATTSPVWEATAVVGAAPRVSYDAWSSRLHGVLMFFAYLFSSPRVPCPSPLRRRCDTAVMSGEPVIRSARANARRRTAACRQPGSGCSHAPRPESRLAASTVTTYSPFPASTATTRSISTASSRLRHPIQVRTGPPEGSMVLFGIRADVSRWITAESTVTAVRKRKPVPDADRWRRSARVRCA